MKRSDRVVLLGLLGAGLAACTGNVSKPGSGPNGTGATTGTPGGSGNSTGGPGPMSGTGGMNLMPGPVTKPPMPFEAVTAQTSVRKVKNLLVGLAPTDADVATVTTMGAAGLQTLINTWMTDTAFQSKFRDKMVFLFRNVFQQTGFSPLDDFKPQLLQNGGFDFGPIGTSAVGDDAFARLVQNLQDSFALTAWGIVSDNRPFTDVLTTGKFMMTTGLKSLYLQIEMPNDQPYAGTQATKLAWKVDYSGTVIPLEDTLNPSSPNYMTFDDQTPMTAARFGLTPTCQGTAGMVNAFSGYAMLFQRLLGFTPRYPFAAQPQCWEHASKPYFTTQDMSDWQWVTVHPLAAGEAYIQPYDLPTLRKATDIGLKLPRFGFYTTPAYLALWNTNDSNQHRVTANQTLLVALGQSYTSANQLIPLSQAGLDANHSVTGSECYGCHVALDPFRQFWGTQYDYNDRNDFPARASFTGAAANPRPATTGGTLAFGSVNAGGASMTNLGALLGRVDDVSDPNQTINRFAMSMTQKLCYFANSTACLETDPEFRRIAKAFQDSSYNFLALVKELMSSPLVTGAGTTTTFSDGGVLVSIARRDQLCASLSNRLSKDVCSLAAPLPSTAQAATIKIAGSISADGFSRGSEIPVTPSDPTLFFRAATEMLCENVAAQVVDPTGGGGVYASTDSTNAMAGMVQNIVGYPASDSHYAQALAILQEHYTSVTAVKGNTATTALRSVFTLACESPTSISFGL